MPYILDCLEWHVLQDLGTLLNERKTQFEPKPLKSDASLRTSFLRNTAVEFFESELRRLFLLNDGSRVLLASEFGECKAALEDICQQLNSLVHPDIPQLPQEQGISYPRLHHLLRQLTDSKKKFNLTRGGGALFSLPESLEQLEKILESVTRSRKSLARLLSQPGQEIPATSTSPEPKEERDTTIWELSQRRGRAIAALAALSGRSKCGKCHEGMLKLSAMLGNTKSLTQTNLDLILSFCSDTWSAVQCGPNTLAYVTPVHRPCSIVEAHARENAYARSWELQKLQNQEDRKSLRRSFAEYRSWRLSHWARRTKRRDVWGLGLIDPQLPDSDAT